MDTLLMHYSHYTIILQYTLYYLVERYLYIILICWCLNIFLEIEILRRFLCVSAMAKTSGKSIRARVYFQHNQQGSIFGRR